MDTYTIALLALAAGGIGYWLGRAHAGRGTIERLARAEATAEAARDERKQADAELDAAQQIIRELERRLAIASEQASFLDEARRSLEDSFRAIAAESLKGSNEQFLTLATERLDNQRRQAQADLDERKTAIATLLEPLQEHLGVLSAKTGEIEKARVQAYSRLDEQIRSLVAATTSLDDKTTSLKTALQGSATAGRWGEVSLRNIAQLAGMTEHCDFTLQEATADGRRPDMVVNLPGDRRIAVDAKVSTVAYMKAAEATNADKRQAELERHAKAMREHTRILGKREYAEALAAEFDMVVMFVPSDAMLGAAFSIDPDLQSDALRANILLATPTILIALLRTVAIYWQQESLATNAREIAAAARELYERAAMFGEHLAGIRKGLDGALDAFNDAVGSYEKRLLPAGRRLEELKVTEQSRREMPEIGSIDQPPRKLGGS